MYSEAADRRLSDVKKAVETALWRELRAAAEIIQNGCMGEEAYQDSMGEEAYQDSMIAIVKLNRVRRYIKRQRGDTYAGPPIGVAGI